MEPLPVWESLVSALADEDSFAHAVFTDMGFVTLTEECLTLACPKNSFVWQQFSETPQLAQHLHRVIEERLGIPARVEYLDQAPSMPHIPTITMLTRARDEAHVQHTNALAREHTSVRALVDNFEAEVSHVRSLRGPEPS
jgi:adenylate kinase family enzyme